MSQDRADSGQYKIVELPNATEDFEEYYHKRLEEIRKPTRKLPTGSMKEIEGKYVCSYCDEYGHNKAGCPQIKIDKELGVYFP